MQRYASALAGQSEILMLLHLYAHKAGEKYLKALIEYAFLDDPDAMNLMHSHNLRALYNRIINKYSLSVDSKSCKWLGGFYYDAGYPGDNFVEVNEQDANECLSIFDPDSGCNEI